MKSRRGTPRAPGAVTIPSCKNFTGYKPCFPETVCYEQCVRPEPVGTRILIVNLDAMGNVLVTTSLLPAIKRKYPESTISWITLANAAPLLRHNPGIDQVYLWEPENWLILGQMKFDLVLNVDKSRRSAAFTRSLNARKKMGFGLNENGAIVPLNAEALENYRLGLNDHLKFRVNTRTVPQLQCEQFGLPYRRDPYRVWLTDEEQLWTAQFRKDAGIGEKDFVVGFNTGCSELYPNKKMTVDQHVELIRRLAPDPGLRLVLLGGPEDSMRNAEIARQAGNTVISTPTTEGVRRGLCSINLCDLVISGDSFGMHAAVALGKPVIVWFGVSSAVEIDIFDRGVKLVPEGLACSPCWKRECPFNLECIAAIDLDRIVGFVRDEHRRWSGTSS
jgi:ADP-heptose:LPS heptosyltransferase